MPSRKKREAKKEKPQPSNPPEPPVDIAQVERELYDLYDPDADEVLPDLYYEPKDIEDRYRLWRELEQIIPMRDIHRWPDKTEPPERDILALKQAPGLEYIEVEEIFIPLPAENKESCCMIASTKCTEVGI